MTSCRTAYSGLASNAVSCATAAQHADDGAHVYIKLPDAAKHAEAPVLFTVDGDGSRTLLNYSVVGGTYVTDRLFDRGVLVAGIDGKERTVSIEKRGHK